MGTSKHQDERAAVVTVDRGGGKMYCRCLMGASCNSSHHCIAPAAELQTLAAPIQGRSCLVPVQH